jgi:hypothetical protein
MYRRRALARIALLFLFSLHLFFLPGPHGLYAVLAPGFVAYYQQVQIFKDEERSLAFTSAVPNRHPVVPMAPELAVAAIVAVVGREVRGRWRRFGLFVVRLIIMSAVCVGLREGLAAVSWLPVDDPVICGAGAGAVLLLAVYIQHRMRHRRAATPSAG